MAARTVTLVGGPHDGQRVDIFGGTALIFRQDRRAAPQPVDDRSPLPDLVYRLDSYDPSLFRFEA